MEGKIENNRLTWKIKVGCYTNCRDILLYREKDILLMEDVITEIYVSKLLKLLCAKLLLETR